MNQHQFENLARLKLLLSLERIGPARVFNLLSRFDSIEAIFEADFSKLMNVDSISTLLAKKINDSKGKLSKSKQKLETELNKLAKLKSRLISYWDEEYPSNLKRIYSPPILLYIKGDLIEQDSNSIAIVGTRNASDYGIVTTKKFGSDLSRQGITIVSGMARGIDSVAHRSALQNGGRTIAVIGSGIDVIYPPENKKLFNEITESGAIVSEFEPGTKPDAQNFPRRNRIISGISKGTLVIETKLNGGAMRTARYALEQNREVFAIPGNIDSSNSEGTNILIQMGEAKLTNSMSDITEELNLDSVSPLVDKKKNRVTELNLFEQSIVEVLDKKPKHIDLIAKQSKVALSDCLVHLLSLELKGYVSQHPGKTFSLIST